MSWKEKSSAARSTKFNELDIEFSKVHEITENSNYSNIIWSGGQRKANNFIMANSLILDFDGTMPIEKAKSEFSRIKNACIVTSKSHKSNFKIDDRGRQGKPITPADFFHVIIGLENPITDINIYTNVVKNLINKYGSDKSCKDGGRFYFCNNKQEVWYS